MGDIFLTEDNYYLAKNEHTRLGQHMIGPGTENLETFFKLMATEKRKTQRIT